MSNIIVGGSLNMDLIIHTPRIPTMMETLLGNGMGDCGGQYRLLYWQGCALCFI